MYKLFEHKLGKYRVYCLSDEKKDFFVKFIPEKGAVISDLRLNRCNIYDGFSNIEDLESLAWGRGLLLAPFPNRLKGGKYSFEGIDYQFPINNPETENALHGFISQLKFTLAKVEINADNASVICHTSYGGQLKYYPFPFTAKVTYSFDNKKVFKMHFAVTNTGQSNMPIGLGWHPYFNLSEKVNDTVLKLPNLDMIEIDENMIPNGKTTPFTIFEKPAKIDDFVLDNCFHVDDKSIVASVTLEGDYGKLIYQQKTDVPYLQIFTPPHRNSIALEPMTCNVDAFNNGKGLKILGTEDTISLACELKMEV